MAQKFWNIIISQYVDYLEFRSFRLVITIIITTKAMSLLRQITDGQ